MARCLAKDCRGHQCKLSAVVHPFSRLFCKKHLRSRPYGVVYPATIILALSLEKEKGKEETR